MEEASLRGQVERKGEGLPGSEGGRSKALGKCLSMPGTQIIRGHDDLKWKYAEMRMETRQVG